MGRRARVKRQRREKLRHATGNLLRRCGQFDGDERCPNDVLYEIDTTDGAVIRTCLGHRILARAQDLVLKCRKITPDEPARPAKTPSSALLAIEAQLADRQEPMPGIILGKLDGRVVVIDRRSNPDEPCITDLPAEVADGSVEPPGEAALYYSILRDAKRALPHGTPIVPPWHSGGSPSPAGAFG